MDWLSRENLTEINVFAIKYNVANWHKPNNKPPVYHTFPAKMGMVYWFMLGLPTTLGVSFNDLQFLQPIQWSFSRSPSKSPRWVAEVSRHLHVDCSYSNWNPWDHQVLPRENRKIPTFCQKHPWQTARGAMKHWGSAVGSVSTKDWLLL